MANHRGDLLAAFRLMRPRQWPILSVQLGVGIVAAGMLTTDGPTTVDAATAWPILGTWQTLVAALPTLVAAWLAWVVLLNGGTLAFNSAYDRDTEPVAYLTTPPLPPRWLSGFALIWMAVGVVVGWTRVSPAFGLLTAICVVLSLLYSHPATRWKARPGFDLAVNMAGYGAGTTLAGLLAGLAAVTGATVDGAGGLPAAAVSSAATVLPAAAWWLVGGFALLFGSFYPLTQLYQLEEDRRRGDRTLATALGIDRSLRLALMLGLAATVCLLTVAWPLAAAWPLALALTAWLGNIAWWLSRWRRGRETDHEHGMYRALVLWAVVDVALLGSLYLALRG